jgi:hypothetical protein
LYENRGGDRGDKKNYIFFVFCVCRFAAVFVNYATHIRFNDGLLAVEAVFEAKTVWFKRPAAGRGDYF